MQKKARVLSSIFKINQHVLLRLKQIPPRLNLPLALEATSCPTFVSPLLSVKNYGKKAATFSLMLI